MDRIPLKAVEREILGKKVARLRRDGLIPAHVFGNKIETEHVSVNTLEFKKVYSEAGETGLVDLKIGGRNLPAGRQEVRPVLIREVQLDPLTDAPLHVDFYQVNLSEKVTVAVPVSLIGDEPEIVHTGEAVVIQPLMEVEVEALPDNLPEKIEVDITTLRAIDDAILVSSLKVPEGVTVVTDPEAVVVKRDNAVTEEMKKLMEEQAAEQAAAAAAPPAGGEAAAEGEAPAEGEITEGEAAEGNGPEESKGEAEKKPAEEKSRQ